MQKVLIHPTHCPTHCPTHDAGRFEWDGYNKTATAEASELGDPLFGKIYPDACDYGFSIRNSETDYDATFYAEEVHENDELTHWILRPTDGSLRAMPNIGGWEVIVFND